MRTKQQARSSFSKKLSTTEDGLTLLLNFKICTVIFLQESKGSIHLPHLQMTLPFMKLHEIMHFSKPSSLGNTVLQNFIAVVVTCTSVGICFPFLCHHIMQKPPGNTVQQSKADRSHFARINAGKEMQKEFFLKLSPLESPRPLSVKSSFDTCDLVLKSRSGKDCVYKSCLQTGGQGSEENMIQKLRLESTPKDHQTHNKVEKKTLAQG